jgi:hypothetical protein
MIIHYDKNVKFFIIDYIFENYREKVKHQI